MSIQTIINEYSDDDKREIQEIIDRWIYNNKGEEIPDSILLRLRTSEQRVPTRPPNSNELRFNPYLYFEIQKLALEISNSNDATSINKIITAFNRRIHSFGGEYGYLNYADFVGFNLATQDSVTNLIDLSDIDFQCADFSSSNFKKVRFVYSNLQYVKFYFTDLSQAHFTGALLAHAEFNGAILSNTTYTHNKNDDLEKINLNNTTYKNLISPAETIAIIEYGTNLVLREKHNTYNQSAINKITNDCSLIKDNKNPHVMIFNQNEQPTYKFNKELYTLISDLSYNLEIANTISDQYYADQKKLNLILKFNESVKKIPIEIRKLQNTYLSNMSFNPKYQTYKYYTSNIYCHFDNIDFTNSNLAKTDFSFSSMKYCIFNKSDITNSVFSNCDLINSQFTDLSSSEKASLISADITGSDFRNQDLNQVNFMNCIAQETRFEETNFNSCNLNNMKYVPNLYDNFNKINFSGSQYHNATLEPDVLSFIEYNHKKEKWEAILNDNNIKYYEKRAIKWFWNLTNYGYSTTSIAKKIFKYTLYFTFVYFLFGGIGWSVLTLEPDVSLFSQYPTLNWLQILLECFYFSIVTMTTLGFGDITVIPGNYLGYGLVALQVILGYVILGALVTRFGTLFNSIGPTITPDQYKNKYKPKK